jgi:glycosidase
LRQNPEYRIQKPGEAEFEIMKLMALFQMTYVGAPMIYYGTESGMWGADDPDDRKPMVWDDLKYEDETAHPLPGKTRPRDNVQFNPDLFAYFKKLIHVRNQHIALRRGSFRTLVKDNERDVYAFERKEGNERIVVVVNNSAQHQKAALGEKQLYVDLMTGVVVSLDSVSLAPRSGAVLTPK